MMTARNYLIKTALIGMTVATLGFTTGGSAAEAKILENTIESQPQTELIAARVKTFKKHHGRKSFKKSFKKAKKYQKHHHGRKKSFGHKKMFGHKTFHLFR